MGWTIDDPRLETVTPVQWEFYMRNIVQDEVELFEQARDLVEYGAMFWNSEGVQQVRRAREELKEATVPLDDTMSQISDGSFD